MRPCSSSSGIGNQRKTRYPHGVWLLDLVIFVFVLLLLFFGFVVCFVVVCFFCLFFCSFVGDLLVCLFPFVWTISIHFFDGFVFLLLMKFIPLKCFIFFCICLYKNVFIPSQKDLVCGWSHGGRSEGGLWVVWNPKNKAIKWRRACLRRCRSESSPQRGWSCCPAFLNVFALWIWVIFQKREPTGHRLGKSTASLGPLYWRKSLFLQFYFKAQKNLLKEALKVYFQPFQCWCACVHACVLTSTPVAPVSCIRVLFAPLL